MKEAMQGCIVDGSLEITRIPLLPGCQVTKHSLLCTIVHVHTVMCMHATRPVDGWKADRHGCLWQLGVGGG